MNALTSSQPMPEGDAQEDVLTSRRGVARAGRWRSRLLGLGLCALLGACLAVGLWAPQLLSPSLWGGAGEAPPALPLKLKSGPFDLLYGGTCKAPRGIVILASGEDGWSSWERNTALHLTALGFAVGGWDSRKFADSRAYVQGDLVEGFQAAVDAVQKNCGVTQIPVWYAGWSAGAEQAVAAAAALQRPPLLVGLLLAAPHERGRYGITAQDLLGHLPEDAGSFALKDHAAALAGLRVAQFAAELDPLDHTGWLSALPGPQRVYYLTATPHDMGGAGAPFLKTLDEAMRWTLEGRERRPLLTQIPARTRPSASPHDVAHP